LDIDAALDEPTHSSALILVSATARTDVGLKRRRNEDAVLELPVEGVFVVADGMGGYRGGDIASALAVGTISRAFQRDVFDGPPHEGIPRRASELARAIQMANAVILERAKEDRELEGMGTTVCAARFAANKQRLYVGHVGDSRMYRYRAGALKRLTSDHTMRDLGVEGEAAGYLSRAVGIWPVVPVDLIFCKPVLGDVYLLCSDGLTKMLNDESICAVIKSGDPPARLVRTLVDEANARGGKDNISVIIIRVQDIGSAVG
jgi:protein phosphatase